MKIEIPATGMLINIATLSIVLVLTFGKIHWAGIAGLGFAILSFVLYMMDDLKAKQRKNSESPPPKIEDYPKKDDVIH